MDDGSDERATRAALATKAQVTRTALLLTCDAAVTRRAHAALVPMVASGWQLVSASTLAAGMAALRADAADVVLLDLFLSDSSGASTYTTLSAACPLTPVLIVARHAHEELAWQITRCGAQAHLLTEQLDAYWLPRLLRRALATKAVDDAAYEARMRAEITLDSMGDAVLCIDAGGYVTFLNPSAERMTGWTRRDAVGRVVADVLPLVESMRSPATPGPLFRAMSENRIVGLAANTVLRTRDGAERSIEYTAAPLHDRAGQVSGAVTVLRDVSASRTVARRLLHLAQHDALTKLPNRLLLRTRLDHALTSACRHGRSGALLFVDLDRFKAVNDTFGHRVGDALLRIVAQRLLASVRASDTVCRLGGDEFVLLLEEIEQPADAAICAAKVLASIVQPCRPGGIPVQMSASIGIGLFPGDAQEAEALLRCADIAMYAAKSLGRNRACFHHDALAQGARRLA